MPVWSDYSPEQFRHWMNSPEVMSELPPEGTPPLTRRFAGAMIGHLNQVCIGDENRKLFLAYVFGVDSTKYLTPKQWVAIYAFLLPKQSAGEGKWYVQADCQPMAKRVIAAQWAMVEQTPLTSVT